MPVAGRCLAVLVLSWAVGVGRAFFCYCYVLGITCKGYVCGLGVWNVGVYVINRWSWYGLFYCVGSWAHGQEADT